MSFEQPDGVGGLWGLVAGGESVGACGGSGRPSPSVLRRAPHCDRVTSIIFCGAPVSILNLVITSLVPSTLNAIRLLESGLHSVFNTLPLYAFNSGRMSPPFAGASDNQLFDSLVGGNS